MDKMREFDNIDRDIIKINKDSLLLRLTKCRDYYSSLNTIFGLGGIALSLVPSSYLTETFRNIGPIPGETIRGTFLSVGIFSAIFAIRSLVGWLKLRDAHDPEKITLSLVSLPVNDYPNNQATPDIANPKKKLSHK